jgi:hypothetical protein
VISELKETMLKGFGEMRELIARTETKLQGQFSQWLFRTVQLVSLLLIPFSSSYSIANPCS